MGEGVGLPFEGPGGGEGGLRGGTGLGFTVDCEGGPRMLEEGGRWKWG